MIRHTRGGEFDGRLAIPTKGDWHPRFDRNDLRNRRVICQKLADGAVVMRGRTRPVLARTLCGSTVARLVIVCRCIAMRRSVRVVMPALPMLAMSMPGMPMWYPLGMRLVVTAACRMHVPMLMKQPRDRGHREVHGQHGRSDPAMGEKPRQHGPTSET